MLNMEPDLAGKITGMLLEMTEGDVIAIIEDKMACQEKVCPYMQGFGGGKHAESVCNSIWGTRARQCTVSMDLLRL